MNKKANLEWLKFLFSIGFSGIFAVAVLFCLAFDINRWISTLFLLLTLFASLFPKAHTSSLTIFTIGSLLFLIDKNYKDMGLSILFAVAIALIWIFKDRENIE